MRGGNVNRYQMLAEAKQGEVVYLRREEYLRRYARDARIGHYEKPRVAFQEASPIDNWRRLIPAYMPARHICGHTLRYFSTDASYDILTLLACFASSLCEWRFNLTSTNNHVNAYEVDELLIPRFHRLEARDPQQVPVDWERWDAVLTDAKARGAADWEKAVLAEMMKTPPEADAWPDTIHDALAAAGKEMSRLGEKRQELTNGFSAWLVEEIGIDEDTFSGMTHIRGGQANFDRMGWQAFHDMLERNRRACKADLAAVANKLEKRYTAVSTALSANRERFSALDAAIDRIVWQLVGLNADGTLPPAASRTSGRGI